MTTSRPEPGEHVWHHGPITGAVCKHDVVRVTKTRVVFRSWCVDADRGPEAWLSRDGFATEGWASHVGLKYFWSRTVAKATETPRRVRSKRSEGPVPPPIDVPRDGVGVIGVARLPDGRHLWAVWADGGRLLAHEGIVPDGWGIVPVSPFDAIWASLGKARESGRSDAFLAAAAWFEKYSPTTFRGSAWVDSLARWWVAQLTARGEPTMRPVASTGPAPEFARVLGIVWPCDRPTIVHAFRRRVLATHPDRGGSANEFIAVKRAYDAALAAAV